MPVPFHLCNIPSPWGKKILTLIHNIPLKSLSIIGIKSCLDVPVDYSRYSPNHICLFFQRETVFLYVTFRFLTALLVNLQGNCFSKHKSQARLEIKSSESIFRYYVSSHFPFRIRNRHLHVYFYKFGPRVNGAQKASKDIFKAKNSSSTSWSTLNNKEHKVFFLNLRIGEQSWLCWTTIIFKISEKVMKLFMRQ